MKNKNYKIKDSFLEASIEGYFDTLFYGFKVAKKRYKRKIKDLVRSELVIVLKNRRKRGSNGFVISGE